MLGALLLCWAALVPQRAQASTDYPAPFVDSFSSYPTNWTEAPSNAGSGGRTGFMTFSGGNCFLGDCIGADNGGSLFVGVAGRTATGYSQGAFVFYAKTNGGGFYDISPCLDNGAVGSFGCGSSGTSGAPLEGVAFNSSIGTALLTDGAYHQYAMLWRVEPVSGTYYDFCTLIDSEDPDNCTWVTSTATVASGDIFGFFMRTDSWNTSGRYLYIDELSALAEGIPPDTSTHIIYVDPAPDSFVSATTSSYDAHVGYLLSGDNYSGGDGFLRMTLQQMGGSGPTGIHNLFAPPAFY